MSDARLERMYAEHAPKVAAYALRRIDASTVDDVVSEVFLVAWRRIGAAPDDELPWLLGIARKVLANTRRSGMRQAALRRRLASRAPGAAAAEPNVDWPLLRALARLRPRDREALLLVAWDGLAADRAAAALGLPKRSFDARLYRARRRLESELHRDEKRSAKQPGEAPCPRTS